VGGEALDDRPPDALAATGHDDEPPGHERCP
jgi:hypothetical protein